MKRFLIVTVLTVFSSIGYSQNQRLSFDECRNTLYTYGGTARGNLGMAQASRVCSERTDAKFINCVTDLYQDIGQSYSFEGAVATCRSRVPLGPSPFEKVCIETLRTAAFSYDRAEQLCAWSSESRSLAIPKCVALNYNDAGNRKSNESLVMDCYDQFNRGELTEDGVNKKELERKRREAELRRIEDEKRRAEAERRAAEQRAAEQRAAAQKAAEQKAAEQRRQEELRRQEEQRRQSDQQRTQDQKRLDEQKRQEEQRKRDEEKKKQEEQKQKPSNPPTSASGGGVIVDLPNFE